MKNADAFSRDLWHWFLARTKQHDGYGWSEVPKKVSSHLGECGINYAKSGDPDVGSVSEFDGTDSDNVDIEAITAESWICNCGKYGSEFRSEAKAGVNLAIPGPYPLSRMMYEVIKESES
jgi:hypothetical protein